MISRNKTQQIPVDLRRRLEQSLGWPLDGVRLHTGPRAQQLCRANRAQALTVNDDIYFANATLPRTPRELQVLAHEVIHVVQNRRRAELGGAPPDRFLSDEDDKAELEAHALAPLVLEGRPVRILAAPAALVQRLTVDGFKAHVPVKLFNNWRNFIYRNISGLQHVITLYEKIFTANEKQNLTDIIINGRLSGALLDQLQPLTSAQVLQLFIDLERPSPGFQPASGLTPPEIRALLTTCCAGPVNLPPTSVLALAHGVSRPRFLLELSPYTWRNPFTNAPQTTVQCLIGALAVLSPASLATIFNRVIQLNVHRHGAYDRVCNLLALIPDTPAPETNIMNFLGDAGPDGGGWPQLFDFANQFVASGRKRRAAGPSKFQNTGLGGGAQLAAIHFHPNAHVETLSFVALFEPAAQTRLNCTISLYESRVRHFCNAHTMRHCSFSQRLLVAGATDLSFFPAATTEADVAHAATGVLNTHSAALQASALESNAVDRPMIHFPGYDVGLYTTNTGDGTMLELNHFMPTGGSTIQVTRNQLRRIKELFDDTSFDPSGK